MDLDDIKSYAFDLPQELIAQSPSLKREDAKLLVVRRNPTRGMPQFEDLVVSDLLSLVDQEPELKQHLWLRNVSKVIPARFYVLRKKRDTSGGFSRHEVVFLKQDANNSNLANVILRGSKKFNYPETVVLEQNRVSIELLWTRDYREYLQK